MAHRFKPSLREPIPNRTLKMRIISTNRPLMPLDIYIFVVRFCEFNQDSRGSMICVKLALNMRLDRRVAQYLGRLNVLRNGIIDNTSI